MRSLHDPKKAEEKAPSVASFLGMNGAKLITRETLDIGYHIID
jgi:hypothetical protein